jgi:hypothetical protein
MSDARWSDPREYDARDRSDEWPRVYDARDRDEHDPREGLMRDLDLPRGDERELVVDRDRVYELDGETAARWLSSVHFASCRNTISMFGTTPLRTSTIRGSSNWLIWATAMRLVKDRILHVWEQRRAEANERTTEQERRVKAVRQKLDQAFLYSESIDLTSYSRQRDKLREELTLAQIDRHTEAVDELDVQGILAFAERILPRASDLWVQASVDYKQRLQALFFPEGIAYDGNRFNRTAATAPLFNYLAPSESADEKMVSQTGIEPMTACMRDHQVQSASEFVSLT